MRHIWMRAVATTMPKYHINFNVLSNNLIGATDSHTCHVLMQRASSCVSELLCCLTIRHAARARATQARRAGKHSQCFNSASSRAYSLSKTGFHITALEAATIGGCATA